MQKLYKNHMGQKKGISLHFYTGINEKVIRKVLRRSTIGLLARERMEESEFDCTECNVWRANSSTIRAV
jgi:hypothetical protein